MAFADLVDANFKNSSLYTSFETYDSLSWSKNRGQTLNGWFTAPVTARYRFYTMCDDACQVLLDSTNAYNALAFVTPAPTVIGF